jgi:hypothetical protein
MVCIGLKTMSGFHLLMESIPMSGSSALVLGRPFTQGQIGNSASCLVADQHRHRVKLENASNQPRRTC